MKADSRVIFSTEVDESGVKNGLTRLKSSLGTFAKAAGIGIAAVASGMGWLAKQGLAYNSQMEQYLTSFTTLLNGNEQAAKDKIIELKEFAANTPFEMTDLAEAQKTILSFGVESDKTSVAMKRLGDISMGNSEKFKGLALVYGQVASTGKLMGQDLLQMINQGFNPLTIIADKTGASMGDLKAVMSGDKTSKEFNKMVKDAQKEVKKLGENASPAAKMLAQIGKEGVISADMVDQAMAIATSEGGLYYGAMEKMSQTAQGQLSTLKDNANTLVGDLFAGASESATTSVMPMAIGYVQQLSDALKEKGTAGLISAFGEILGDVVSRVAENAPAVVTMAVSLITSMVNGLKKNAGKLSAGIAGVLKAAISGISALLPTLFSAFLDIVMSLMGSLAEIAPDLIPEVIGAIMNAIVDLVDNADQLIYAGKDIVIAILTGITRAAPLLLAGVGRVFASLLFGVKDNTKAVNDYVAEKTKGMKEKYDGVITSLTTLKETLNESLTTGAATEESAMTLMDQLEAYSKLEYPTAEDTANAQAMTSSLVGMYSGLSDYVGENGLFNTELTTIRSLIVEYAKEAEALAYRDYLVGLYKQKIEESNQLKVQTAAYKTEDNNLKQLQDQATTLTNLKTAMEALNDTPKDWSSEDTITKVKALAQAYKDAGGDLSALGIDLDNLGDSSYDEFIAMYDDLSGKSIPKLDLDIASQQALLDTLMNGDAGIVALQTLIKNTQGDINNVGQTIAGLNTVGATTGENVVDGIVTGANGAGDALGGTDLQPVAGGLERGIREALDSHSPAKSMFPVGEDITAGIVSGMADDTAKLGITTAAQSLKALIAAAMTGDENNAEDGLNSVGSAISQKIGKAIEDSTEVKGAVLNVVSSATSPAVKVSAGLKSYTIGSAMTSGIASGIASHASQVQSALQKVVDDAIKAIKRTLGIASPSTVTRDLLGKNLADGISVGFVGQMVSVRNKMESAIAASVSSAAKAGQGALGNTLLGKVSKIGGVQVSSGMIGSLATNGTTYGITGASTGSSAGTSAATVSNTYNFYQPIQAPDEVARAIRRQATYGLAGARA